MKINTNICVITGNVVRDAELRYTAKQTPVLGFTVACNRQGPDGQSVADFFSVVLWGKSAEALEKYLTKGKSVLVKGRLQTRSYETKTGEKRNVTEIIADSFGGVELLGGGERQQSGVGAPPQSRRNDTGAENVVQPYEISCLGAPPQSRRNDWPPQEGNAQFSAPPPSGTFPADNGEEASIPF